jgi:putative sterol carrier protein
MTTVNYNTRPFAYGDEAAIVELFNSTFKDYAGYVPRTVEYWKWSCLQRPDVTTEGIMLACKGNKIVGYIVLGKTGNIWEFCYDKTEKAELIVSELLIFAVNYLEKAKAESILLNYPSKDAVVKKVCKKLGLAESPPEYVSISVLNFPRLISDILKESGKESKINCSISFKLHKSPTSLSKCFYADLKNGKITILEQNNLCKPEIVFEMDEGILLLFILGKINGARALLFSKMRVKPLWKIRKALKILSLLKNNSPWYMPRADIG